ncbi:Leucine-rich repeat transmembrane protein kinase [Prunus dulcis]|uniref:Leucine-rich repeat transmembrane protein kinase n=1 Tax=Prunus dulcis TaxID=3755 RepID=A0A4Y1QY50_PRUDU|nr:Leucine-rich repeat transmembrane protein kinase [Prunus dulcis]
MLEESVAFRTHAAQHKATLVVSDHVAAAVVQSIKLFNLPCNSNVASVTVAVGDCHRRRRRLVCHRRRDAFPRYTERIEREGKSCRTKTGILGKIKEKERIGL